MVSMLVIKPIDNRNIELKWNHITKPVVKRRAERAPVSGHGLGLTI